MMPFKKIKKAVIPAAGLGTRFLPATKVLPKELLPIVDKPSIQYIVEEAVSAGVTEIIFVISEGKEQVVSHFNHHIELENHLRNKGKMDDLGKITALTDSPRYTVVYQPKPLGLGHAVLCAKQAVGNDDFFVFLPDDLIDHDKPCALQMLESWQNHQSPMVAVMEVAWEEVHLYGVVKANPIATGIGKIEDVVEKPKRDAAPSNLAIIGRYLLPPSIFQALERVAPGAIGEIQLTDALLEVIKGPGLYAFQFEGERFDTGNKRGFIEANINYALKHEDMRADILEYIRVIAESR